METARAGGPGTGATPEHYPPARTSNPPGDPGHVARHVPEARRLLSLITTPMRHAVEFCGAGGHTVGMEQLDEIVVNVRTAFELVHRKHFLGDPVANPRLVVDVLDPAVVVDTPALLLLTPWTINGLAFPPDDKFPEVLELAGRRRTAFRVEMAELGPFRSVNLPLEAAGLRNMAQARGLTRSWAGHFMDAVGAARAARADHLGPETGAPNDPERLPHGHRASPLRPPAG